MSIATFLIVCLVFSPNQLSAQNHLVVKPNQRLVLDQDPGPLSYILVQGQLRIDYPGDGELRAGRIIIDGGHLEIGRPDLPYLNLLDIVIGGQLDKDAPPALVVKNGGQLDIHGQFDEAGNTLLQLQAASADDIRKVWLSIEADARSCRLSGINLSGFNSDYNKVNSATLKWVKAAGFIKSCNFRYGQGNQLWLDKTKIQVENCNFQTEQGAALVVAPSGKGSGNQIRHNRFEVKAAKYQPLPYAIQIGHPMQTLENNALMVENCKIGLWYNCPISAQGASNSASFSLKDNNIYQRGDSRIATTGLLFDVCNSEDSWSSTGNQISGFDLGAHIKGQQLELSDWDLNDNIVAIDGAAHMDGALAAVTPVEEDVLTAKGGDLPVNASVDRPKYKHKLLERAAKMEIYLWRLVKEKIKN